MRILFYILSCFLIMITITILFEPFLIILKKFISENRDRLDFRLSLNF